MSHLCAVRDPRIGRALQTMVDVHRQRGRRLERPSGAAGEVQEDAGIEAATETDRERDLFVRQPLRGERGENGVEQLPFAQPWVSLKRP
ncbi:MAG: hypothetical protein K9J04_03370 [Burkholderiales bacterium]|nr:hypothetical protein [Burkholderiales bacterium]